MKSGTEPDDLLELSCSAYFAIELLCPDVEPLLGSTAPLCKTEKRYSLGDTQLGKKKAPSSSFQSSRSCQTAELGVERRVFMQCTGCTAIHGSPAWQTLA